MTISPIYQHELAKKGAKVEMMLIETYLDKSPIHGVGIFVNEFVKKGTVVWQFHPLIDIILTEEQLRVLPKVIKEFIEIIGFSYPFGVNNYCMSLDHAQYMNHSDTPLVSNIKGDKSIALKDIPKGTELTIDYYKLDHRTDESETVKLSI